MAKVKYPLTPEAKEAAKSLVEAWDKGHIPQLLTVSKGPLWYGVEGVTKNSVRQFEVPLIDLLLELSEFNLVSITVETLTHESNSAILEGTVHIRRWYVVLMQELRNAVANDF